MYDAAAPPPITLPERCLHKFLRACYNTTATPRIRERLIFAYLGPFNNVRCTPTKVGSYSQINYTLRPQVYHSLVGDMHTHHPNMFHNDCAYFTLCPTTLDMVSYYQLINASPYYRWFAIGAGYANTAVVRWYYIIDKEAIESVAKRILQHPDWYPDRRLSSQDKDDLLDGCIVTECVYHNYSLYSSRDIDTREELSEQVKICKK